MLSLILILLLLWFVITVFLAAWTLFFQAYIYTQPVDDLTWRAPAAGTALAAFVCLWVVLDYNSDPPGRYQTLFEFSASNDQEYPELRIPTANGEEVYRRATGTDGRSVYRKGDKTLPSRPDQIIAIDKETKEKFIFRPERDADGKFKEASDGSLHYRDETGRIMVEGQFGKVETRRASWLIVNLLLNFVMLALWFVCFWLLLRFQWSHALGLAVVLWGIMQIFVLPTVLGRAEAVALTRQKEARANQ